MPNLIAGTVSGTTNPLQHIGSPHVTVEQYNNDTGDYLITYTGQFKSWATGVATAMAGGSNIFVATIRSVGISSMRVQIANLANESVSSDFTFMIAGE